MIALLVLACFHVVYGQATCQCDSNTNALQCTLDETQRYAGNTSIAFQQWTLCNSATFAGTLSLNLLEQQGTQSIILCENSYLTIGGDLVIPDSNGLQTVSILKGDNTQNTSLVVFGSLVVNDNLEVAVASLTVHGNIIINKGNVSLATSSGHVNGNFQLGNVLTQLNGESGQSTQATFAINGSLSGPDATINMSAIMVVVQGSATVQEIDITGLHNTFVIVNNTASIQTLKLGMIDADKDYFTSTTFHPLNFSSFSVTPVVEFVELWTCADPHVNVSLWSDYQVNTTGVSFSLMRPDSLTSAESCCLTTQECLCLAEHYLPLPPLCSNVECIECQLSIPQAIAGWVVGAVLLIIILTAACGSLIADCIVFCDCA